MSNRHRSQSARKPSKVQPQANMTVVRVGSDVLAAPSRHDAPNEKDTAFYSACVNAWISTKMEKDKSLLTLATGGVGLLVTLLTTIGTQSVTEVFLYGGAFAAFLVTIICTITVFGKNASHMESLIKNKDDGSDRYLNRLDRVIIWSFIIGLLFSMSLGVKSGVNHFRHVESVVSDKNSSNRPGYSDSNKSLGGLGSLRPESNQSNNPPATSNPTGTGGGGSSSSGSGQGEQK